MKSEDIFDGITDIRDDLIKGATEAPKKKKRWTKKHWTKKYWMGAVAAVLTLAILMGDLLPFGDGLTAYAIAEAAYPEMASFPSGLAQFNDKAHDAWWEDVLAQRRELGDISDLQTFLPGVPKPFWPVRRGKTGCIPR